MMIQRTAVRAYDSSHIRLKPRHELALRLELILLENDELFSLASF